MPEQNTRVTCAQTFTHTEYYVEHKYINDKGTMFGGQIMSLMDVCGGLSVARAVGLRCMTVGVDHVQFIKAPMINDFFSLESYVSGIGSTSIEVFIRMYLHSDDMQERELAVSAFYTYVPVHDDGSKVTHLPELLPESEEEQYVCDGYAARRHNNNGYREWINGCIACSV